MFGVLNQAEGHLFDWSFKTASLDYLSRLGRFLHSHEKSRSKKPDFPLDVFRATEHRVCNKANRFLVLANSLVHLSCFNVNFPLKLLTHVLMQVV